ncbi:MAG: hypothetical protein WBG69_04860 [Arcobacteraceae bacterium]
MKQKAIKKDTKILRVMNWVFSFALIFGSLMVIFQATQTGTLYLLIFIVLAIGAFIMPAILLYSGTSKIFTIPLVLDKKNKLFYKISIAANFLFLLVGVGIIITAVYTGQYIIVVLGFIFTLLASSNVKALDICVKELSDV